MLHGHRPRLSDLFPSNLDCRLRQEIFNFVSIMFEQVYRKLNILRCGGFIGIHEIDNANTPPEELEIETLV